MDSPTPSFKVVLVDDPRLAFEDTATVARTFLESRLGGLPGATATPWQLVGSPATLTADFIDRHADDSRATLVTSLTCPLLDTDLVHRMLVLAQAKQAPVQVAGAVPGTAPAFVLPPGGGSGRRAHQLLWDTQRTYNTQVDLVRLKRVKLFRSFLRRFEDFPTWSVPRLLDFCGTPAGVQFLLSYGEDMTFERYAACPSCGNAAIYDLHSDGGHPVMGFFTRASVYYQCCGDCGLVFQNPVARREDLARYYDGYETEAVFARPIEQRHADLSCANTSHLLNYKALLDHHGHDLRTGAAVVDLGGGQGEFCVYAKNRRPDLDVRLVDHAVAPTLAASLAKYGVRSSSQDIAREDLGDSVLDLITMWEVIEHLRVEDLQPLLARLHRALMPGGLLALSTPDFEDPYCRALDFWAMAPGHHVTVLSRRALQPMLEGAGFAVLAEHHESVTMKSADRWFGYGARCGASLEARGCATVVDDVLRDEAIAEPHRAWMRQNGLGSELILVAQKIRRQSQESA